LIPLRPARVPDLMNSFEGSGDNLGDGADGAISREPIDLVLHELSQPLTVLLCTLEAGCDLESVAELRSAMNAALVECERMRATVVAWRSKVRRPGY